MIRRLFWLVLGTAFGAWSALRLKRLLRGLLPDRLAHQATGLGQTVRTFTGDVRDAMNSREEELRDALRLDAHTDMDKDPH